jgi:hypothetical protein
MKKEGMLFETKMLATIFNGKRFLNLTPHNVTIFADDGVTVLADFAKSGWIIRLSETHAAVDINIGLPVFYKKMEGGTLSGPERQSAPVEDLLPELTPGTIVISSSFTVSPLLDLIVKNKLEGVEVVVPDTGPQNAVRDERGTILGSKCFALERPLEN